MRFRIPLSVIMIVLATLLFSGCKAAHEHEFEGWTIAEEATCTKDGLQKRVCKTCGFEESGSIVKMPHSFGSDNKCTHCNGIKAGENVAALYDNATKTLTLIGNGPTADLDPASGDVKPWGSEINASMEKVIVGDGITSIGICLFSSSGLKTIEIGKDVETIGYRAFSSSKLTELNIPGSVKKLGGLIVEGCADLGSVTLNEGLEEMAPSVFYLLQAESIALPSTLSKIPDWAFESAAIKTIEIPSSVTEIGKGAFFGSAIESFTVPPQITEISDKMFAESQLKKITFHDGITRIGAAAFMNCSLEIEEGILVIPAEVRIIGPNAFHIDNSKSYLITFNDKLEYLYNEAFFTGFKCDSFELPASLKGICKEALATRDGIESVTFKSEVPPEILTRVFFDTAQFTDGRYTGDEGSFSPQSPLEYRDLKAYVPDEALAQFKEALKRTTNPNEPFAEENIIGVSSRP